MPSGVGSIEQLMPRHVRRLGDAQRHHQVVEQQHRPAARRADDVAQRIDPPTFGRPGQHDVVLLGIDQHVLARAANRPGSGRRRAAACLLAAPAADFGFQAAAATRTAARSSFSKSAGTSCKPAATPACSSFSSRDFRIRDDAVDIDLHAADRAAAEELGLGPTSRRRCYAASRQHRGRPAAVRLN